MRLKFLYIIAGVTLLWSCEPIDDCTEEENASSIIYSFPDSLQVGTPYDLKIHYILENSCGSFLEFKDTTYDNTTEIKAVLLYEGCNCSLQFEEDSSSYSILHDQPGNYTYKFLVGATDYDSYTLTVFQ